MTKARAHRVLVDAVSRRLSYPLTSAAPEVNVVEVGDEHVIRLPELRATVVTVGHDAYAVSSARWRAAWFRAGRRRDDTALAAVRTIVGRWP